MYSILVSLFGVIIYWIYIYSSLVSLFEVINVETCLPYKVWGFYVEWSNVETRVYIYSSLVSSYGMIKCWKSSDLILHHTAVYSLSVFLLGMIWCWNLSELARLYLLQSSVFLTSDQHNVENWSVVKKYVIFVYQEVPSDRPYERSLPNS